jgi:predicted site-specific integrase-resolvase
MKAKEVLKLLKISRVTLVKYVKIGKIKVTKLGNGYYDYDSKSVNEYLNNDNNRINVIYSRVSTYKQKNDLGNQILNILDYCDNNNIEISKIYKDISSGINFERKDFSSLIDDVMNYKINNIYISYKDRLTRTGFNILENIFKKFNTNIIVINNTIYQNDLFDELISIIHLFSTKSYSNRRKSTINECVKLLNNN